MYFQSSVLFDRCLVHFQLFQESCLVTAGENTMCFHIDVLSKHLLFQRGERLSEIDIGIGRCCLISIGHEKVVLSHS